MHSRLSSFIALCGLSATIGCSTTFSIIENIAGPILTGSGVVVVESREVAPFHAIELDSNVKATVIMGEPQPIELSGEDNILPFVTTAVRNGVLEIDINYDGSVRTTEPLTATIVTPSLDRIELDGACSADVSGTETDRLSIDMDGASRLKITCQSTTVDAKLDGACQLEIAGNCQQFKADADGAARINALELIAENVNIKVDGAARAKVYATEQLTADADGASSVRYAGDPIEVNPKKDGASTIRPIN